MKSLVGQVSPQDHVRNHQRFHFGHLCCRARRPAHRGQHGPCPESVRGAGRPALCCRAALAARPAAAPAAVVRRMRRAHPDGRLLRRHAEPLPALQADGLHAAGQPQPRQPHHVHRGHAQQASIGARAARRRASPATCRALATWRPRSAAPMRPTSRWDQSAWKETWRASRYWRPSAPPCRSSSGCRC